MSVQAGIWDSEGEPINRKVLARISRALAEYGPDGEAMHFDGLVGMLYRPFHTTSDSRLERQPFVSRTGMLMTWDGRLDNRDELIAMLRDDLPNAPTEPAIVMAGVEKWGTDCFGKLIGDWALAIWEPHNSTLTLARDYVGIRQLFYYPQRQRVVWCSHLAPLVLCGDQLTLSDEYIAGYLTLHPSAHLTPYREISSVPPGNFVCVHKAKVTVHPYWVFDFTLKTLYKTDAEYEEHYWHLFRQAVRRRLRTDSPILADLSGGLDSSSIVCMADNIMANEGACTPRMDTFSHFDSNEPGDDSLFHLTKVEEKRGRKGFHTDLKGAGNSLSFAYRDFVAAPGFGSRAEITAAISEVSRQNEYRVVLSGVGGDEMNGQPLDPMITMAELLVQLRFGELAKQLKVWSLRRRTPLIQLFLQILTHVLPISIGVRFTQQGHVDRWVDRKFARKHDLSNGQLTLKERAWFSRPRVRDSMDTIQTLARQMSYVQPSVMERRYPFLDQTLVEFLSTIPFDQLLRPGQRRSLMRRSLAKLLPQEILLRKTKSQAARCYSIALEKHWDEVNTIFGSPLSARVGYINGDLICVELAAIKNGQIPAYVLRVFKALSLELWLRDVNTRGVIHTQPSAPLSSDTGSLELTPDVARLRISTSIQSLGDSDHSGQRSSPIARRERR
jgi:asparagine synthase (glutamine-hydrolysing)